MSDPFTNTNRSESPDNPVRTNDDLALLLVNRYPRIHAALDEIRQRFAQGGFTVYLVGGAVRNLALGTPLNDIDLATDAHPEDVMRLFKSVIPTGIKHGTVTLVKNKEHYEITTFRVDGAYSDSRRPDSVAFTPDIGEDLKRRDFTINAMALDLDKLCLLDPHDGRADLSRRIIRTVGEPLDRFTEDGLRIVRGLRFACQLGFDIEEKTLQAMSQTLDKLAQVSIERFRDELGKILKAGQPDRGLELLQSLKILEIFLPELHEFARMEPSGFDFIRKGCSYCPRDPQEIRWACMIALLADDVQESILGRLKLPNQFVRRVLAFARGIRYRKKHDWSDADLRRFIASFGNTDVIPMIELLKALDLAELSESATDDRKAAQTMYDIRKERILNIMNLRPPLSMRDLAVNGSILQAEGIPAGPGLGRTLEFLLEQVLEDPSLNQKNTLIAMGRTWYGNQSDSGIFSTSPKRLT